MYASAMNESIEIDGWMDGCDDWLAGWLMVCVVGVAAMLLSDMVDSRGSESSGEGGVS